jgi:hypothetical protein
MASPGSPEAALNSHEAAALKPSAAIPRIAENSVPSQQGNQIILAAEAGRANSADGLPAMHITGAESTTKTLANVGTTEAIAGGTGAAAGAAGFGAVGKYIGSLAELVMKSPEGAASISDTMAFDLAKAGALRGGLAGLAIGALAIGSYEVLKQSAEHPDRAPDMATLI